MIKVSVMYANEPGARFDHEYYRDKHLPMIKAKMGDACSYYTIDKAISIPGEAPALYIAMCHIFSESLEVFQKGFGPYGDEFTADVINYTDLTPVKQISEVVVGSIPNL